MITKRDSATVPRTKHFPKGQVGVGHGIKNVLWHCLDEYVVIRTSSGEYGGISGSEPDMFSLTDLSENSRRSASRPKSTGLKME